MTAALDNLLHYLRVSAEAVGCPIIEDGDDDMLDTKAGSVELRTYDTSGHRVARAIRTYVGELRALGVDPAATEDAEAVKVALLYGMPVRTAAGRWTVSPWASMVPGWQRMELPQVDAAEPEEALLMLGRNLQARRPA